jgi:hypothetical protein
VELPCVLYLHMEASQHSLLAACFTLHSINATLLCMCMYRVVYVCVLCMCRTWCVVSCCVTLCALLCMCSVVYVVWCSVWGVLCVVHTVCCVCCVCKVHISTGYICRQISLLLRSSFYFLFCTYFLPVPFLSLSLSFFLCLYFSLLLSVHLFASTLFLCVYSSIPLSTITSNTSIDLSATHLGIHPCTYLFACCTPGRSCPSSGVGRRGGREVTGQWLLRVMSHSLWCENNGISASSHTFEE